MGQANLSFGYYLVHWVVSGLALLLTSHIIPGFVVTSFGASLVAAVFIGIANIVIWPILMILTLPVNILTLGLFTLVINGAVLKICAGLLPGFAIHTWTAAILGALVLAVVSTILHYLFV